MNETVQAPKEPTEEMVVAGMVAYLTAMEPSAAFFRENGQDTAASAIRALDGADFAKVYRAMLGAIAPQIVPASCITVGRLA